MLRMSLLHAKSLDAALGEERKKLGRRTDQAEASASAAKDRCAELERMLAQAKSELRSAALGTIAAAGDRAAELRRRQAAGELTPEEAAELARAAVRHPAAAQGAVPARGGGPAGGIQCATCCLG